MYNIYFILYVLSLIEQKIVHIVIGFNYSTKYCTIKCTILVQYWYILYNYWTYCNILTYLQHNLPPYCTILYNILALTGITVIMLLRWVLLRPKVVAVTITQVCAWASRMRVYYVYSLKLMNLPNDLPVLPPRQGAPVSFGRSKKNARACHCPGKNHFCSGRVRTENLLIPNVRRSHSSTLLQRLENRVFSVSLYTIKLERPAGGHDNGTPASGYKICTCQFIFKLI